MITKKVIHTKYLAVRFPISFTIALYLLMDRLHANAYIKGAAWAVMTVVWILVLVTNCHEKQVELEELLNDRNKTSAQTKS